MVKDVTGGSESTATNFRPITPDMTKAGGGKEIKAKTAKVAMESMTDADVVYMDNRLVKSPDVPDKYIPLQNQYDDLAAKLGDRTKQISDDNGAITALRDEILASFPGPHTEKELDYLTDLHQKASRLSIGTPDPDVEETNLHTPTDDPNEI